jgi:hypothetical protein
MSAILNMNEIPYIPWKGKTFTQITTTLQKNKGVNVSNSSITNLFKPNPLKLYRREIASITMSRTTPCNIRTSVKIDEFNMPNGYLVYNSKNNRGLASTLDITLPNSQYELNAAKCNASNSCFNQAANALRRVRSSGNIKKTPYKNHNDTGYYTSTSQYLTSRNRTYQQNQFQYSLTRPTDNSTAYCKPVYKPNNAQFSQQGAVSSSTLTNRKDYDTITQAGASLRSSFGSAAANALAYGVPTPGYTVKDKLGYPLKCTPVINKYDGTLKKSCNSKVINVL